MSGPAPTTREDFESWLAHMPVALQHFLETLPDDIREKLDYSLNSMDDLEDWLLRTYPSKQSMLAQTEAAKVGGSARYIGETIRKEIGGHWDIRLDDPALAFFGMPILTGFGEKSFPICPLTLVAASADRRTGRFIRTFVDNEKRRLASKGNERVTEEGIRRLNPKQIW